MADSTTKTPLPPAKRAALEQRCSMALAAMRLMNHTAGGLPARFPDLRTGSAFYGLTDAVLAFYDHLRAEG